MKSVNKLCHKHFDVNFNLHNLGFSHYHTMNGWMNAAVAAMWREFMTKYQTTLLPFAIAMRLCEFLQER